MIRPEYLIGDGLIARNSEREIELGSCVRRACGIGWKVGWHKY